MCDCGTGSRHYVKFSWHWRWSDQSDGAWFSFFYVYQGVSTGFTVHYCLFAGYQSGSDRRYGNDSAGAAVLSCSDGHRRSSGRYHRQQDQQEDRG